MATRVKEPLGPRIDQAIFAVFPKWGARRIAMREKLALTQKLNRAIEDRFSSRFEGASHDRTRGDKWMASRLSTDSALEQDLETMRERSRELYQNEAIAASAIDGNVTNVIGCGLTPQARVTEEPGILTAEQADRINWQLEDVYARWAQSVAFVNRQQQMQRLRKTDGDVLVHLFDRGGADKPIPLDLDLISAGRLETPPDHQANPLVRLGVERDSSGQVIAYHVRASEPGDAKDFRETYVRLPKRDKDGTERVLHFAKLAFVDQSRGWPWLAPVLSLIKDNADYRFAELVAKQVEACTALTVESEAARDLMTGQTSEITPGGKRIEDMEPGRVLYLRPGEKANMLDPKRPGSGFDQWMSWVHRLIAGALGYPFELLLKKYENSYAGGRLALIDGRASFRCEQQLLIAQVLCPIWKRIVREAVIVGAVDIDPRAYNRAPWAFERHLWTPPTMEWIDPTAEVQAARDAIEANLDTQAGVLAAQGKDWEEVLQQRQREKLRQLEYDAELAQRRSELGLVDPTDPAAEEDAAVTQGAAA